MINVAPGADRKKRAPATGAVVVTTYQDDDALGLAIGASSGWCWSPVAPLAGYLVDAASFQ
ncbi:hypothetical protein GCM10009827_103980 [Dactylosporangium maewongense]|uniref:Uncharacterized protein n=1 Tax=Dactylosporangium maewongense TaxID=634393 RepID=A0ABN2CY72_9ACTN